MLTNLITTEISTLPSLRLMTKPPLDMPGFLSYLMAIGRNRHPEADSVVLLWHGEPIAGWVRNTADAQK